MLIGGMNHPQKEIAEEIAWMVELGLGFIDLTLEPPAAASWRVDADDIRARIEANGLQVVGHTAYYLPFASPIEEVRRGALQEFHRCIDQFAKIGARYVNLHPDRHAPMHDRSFYIEKNIESLRELIEHAGSVGVEIMIENLPGDYNSAPQLGELLDPLPEIGLHLDIGHANLIVPHNTTGEILAAYGSRLRHVHLHDNKGGHADLHLPLGTGTVDVPQAIRELKRCGYDGTITLEVFSPDRRHFEFSRDLLRKLWDEIEVEAESVGADGATAGERT
jgi:sugar phosphate isomerase/epimerase